MSNHHHESDTSTGSPNNNSNRNSPGFYGTTLFPPPLPPGRGPSNVPLPPSSSPNQPLGSYQNHHSSGIVDGHLDQLEPHHVFGGSGAESTPSLVGLNQTVAERSSQTLLLESSSKSTLGTMNNSLNSTTNSSSAQGNRSSSTSNNNNSNNNNTTNDNSSNSGRDRAEGTPPPPPLQNDLITTTPSSGPTLVLGIPTSPARGPGEHHNNYYHGAAAVQQNASAAHPAVGSAFFDQSSEEGSPTHLNIPSLDAAAGAMNAIPLYHSSGSSTSDGGNPSSGRGETNIFPQPYPAAPTSSPVPAGCLNTMSMMMLSSGTHSSSSENSSSHLHNNCLLAVTAAAESPIVPPIPISQHPHTSSPSHHHHQQHFSRQPGNPQSQTLDGGMTTVHYQQHAPNDVSNQSTRANIQQKTPQVTATSCVAPRFTPPPQSYSTQSPPLVFSPHRQDPLSISSNSPQTCSLLPPSATAATHIEEIQGKGKDSAIVTTTATWEPPLILHGPSSPAERVADMLGEEIRSDSLTRYALPYRASSSASGTSPRLSRRASIAHYGQSSPPAPTGNLHFLSSEEGVRDGGGEDGMLSSPHLHVLTPSVSESDLRRLRVLQRNQDGPLLEEAEDAFHDTTVVEIEETELLDELRHNAPSSGGESIDEPEDPLWWMEAFEEHVADMTTENKLALGI